MTQEKKSGLDIQKAANLKPDNDGDVFIVEDTTPTHLAGKPKKSLKDALATIMDDTQR